LWITVFREDDDAAELWAKGPGVARDRIIRLDEKDNFWQMGETGPCGPCSEIHYDLGPEASEMGHANCAFPCECGRYVEIWNLVFMQFDRAADGTLSKLPAPCVDTGMGLERLAAVLQHVHSNYEIDLFQRLIKKAAELTGTKDLENKSLRVIADHIRACSFLIVDGVLPSNEGRGYVLRRIIRRALRHGYMLGQKQPFFHKLVPTLVAEMGEAYPDLPAKQTTVEMALFAEEERFGETLENGMKVFDEIAARSGKSIPGADAFRLYDTYGFPVDLTADIARERGLTVDMEGFEKAMSAQRERARAASQFETKASISADLVQRLKPTQFLGYGALDADALNVVGIVREGREVLELRDGEEAMLLLDATPFYAESGGQVGDTGELSNADGRFVVADTIKLAGAFHGHAGKWSGKPLRIGAPLAGSVDAARRQATVLNHSATHLLHAALRQVLGEHVAQKGSLVAPDRLRFDFSHFKPVSHAELRKIEDIVNAEVRRNIEAEVHDMAYQEAIDFGAMALFGEKYGDRVRVLRMGDFSTELCGGTHVARTGDIGLFKIVSESGVAAGIRRIEALTGEGALAHVVDEEKHLAEIAHLLSAGGGDATEKLRQVLDRQKKLEREIDAIKAKAASAAAGDLAASAQDVAGIKVIAARLDGADAKTLRESVDAFKQNLGDCVVLLAGGADGKIALIAGVNGKALGKIKAGELVAHVAGQIGGKGGGRPDMAQGGGEDSPKLAAALAEVPAWVGARLA
jgi:alanyl-tRNA synthetase